MVYTSYHSRLTGRAQQPRRCSFLALSISKSWTVPIGIFAALVSMIGGYPMDFRNVSEVGRFPLFLSAPIMSTICGKLPYCQTRKNLSRAGRTSEFWSCHLGNRCQASKTIWCNPCDIFLSPPPSQYQAASAEQNPTKVGDGRYPPFYNSSKRKE